MASLQAAFKVALEPEKENTKPATPNWPDLHHGTFEYFYFNGKKYCVGNTNTKFWLGIADDPMTLYLNIYGNFVEDSAPYTYFNTYQEVQKAFVR